MGAPEAPRPMERFDEGGSMCPVPLEGSGPVFKTPFVAVGGFRNMKFAEILDLAGDNIRVSPEGKYSIDDVMKYVMSDASQGHRCNTHRRVREQFALKAADRASFPGSGPTTPVATADEIEHLLSLLPAVVRPIGRPRTRRPASKRSALGESLYVMRTSFDAEHVKIGRSRDVGARRAALECGQNFRVECVVVFPGKGHLESSVHALLDGRRSRLGPGREWFAIPVAEAAAVVAGALQQVCPMNQG